MKDLKQFKKRNTKMNSFTTGVNIEMKHKEFIDKHGLVLSEVVRDALDTLMKNNPEPRKLK